MASSSRPQHPLKLQDHYCTSFVVGALIPVDIDGARPTQGDISFTGNIEKREVGANNFVLLPERCKGTLSRCQSWLSANLAPEVFLVYELEEGRRQEHGQLLAGTHIHISNLHIQSKAKLGEGSVGDLFLIQS